MELQSRKKRKIFLLITLLFLIGGVSFYFWNKFAATTKIALVNFQNHTASNIILSNSDKFISFKEISLENLDQLKKYDFVLGNGMGLKINEEQRKIIEETLKKTPIYFKSVTNPENEFNSLNDEQSEMITAYFKSGNKENYQNFARYVRRYIDNKTVFSVEPEEPKDAIEDVYFHVDEKAVFKDISSYEIYLKNKDLWNENAPKVAMIAGIHDPFSGNRGFLDSIIVSFQNAGITIYPIASFSKRFQFLNEINPDAVIYFPHGRLVAESPDQTVTWLKERNIPLFTPLSVSELQEDWEESPFGMVGGFMGQVIVMPELDGALLPYVIIAMEKTKDGLFIYKTIPNRLQKFTEMVSNYIRLKELENTDKKVAVYFFKGEGGHAMDAQGMEASPSLYNTLKRMQKEGYDLTGLPETYEEFDEIIARCGKVISPNSKGYFQEFVEKGEPTLIESDIYDNWLKSSVRTEKYEEVIEKYGATPGSLMAVHQDGKDYLAISKIQFGNVALLPQQLAAIGDDEFKILHGVKEPPTHAYIGSYLWTQKEFKADVLMHFGTHGSLEFTPFKQVALDDNDWSDILVGTIPHFYFYTIGNVGESMMAKRRSYATTVSYLTPAFVETDMRNYFRSLQEKIRYYHKAKEEEKDRVSLEVKKTAVELGIHRPLRLDSNLTIPYKAEEIYRLEDFAEEVATEKINGEFYVAGETYAPEKLHSTVLAMSVDPLAYSIASLDKLRGKITDEQIKRKAFFNEHYLTPSKAIVEEILSGEEVSEETICKIAKIDKKELEKAREILTPKKSFSPVVQKNLEEKVKNEAKTKTDAASGATAKPKKGEEKTKEKATEKPAAKMPPTNPKIEYSKEEKENARAILEIERTLTNIINYKLALLKSPELEMRALLNGMAGGYIESSAGGDAVANPRAVPTGKNMYSVNAEATPTELAWDRGVELAEQTIQDYLENKGEYPRKIAYTFWSSEFVETEGVSLAQALYLLGVEPVRDPFGRVSDVRLIPSKELGRPRIDIVVQTSGQFRDLAASRLFLLNKAIDLAANANDEQFENLVKAGSLDVEKKLVEQGVSPKKAREMASNRIFGGLQGRYDTGIQELIKAGDKWDTQKEIADQYMHNMGAVYGQQEDWAEFQEGMFRAALNNADMIIQPRQNNTWGALSLDHVFEFMGGMNAAIKEVTGKDPEAYLADYRNHHNMRIQELKESIGVEARSTIFNPKFIQEMMKGKASSAGQITEIVTNTFGWEATRPEVIDDELWDEIYDTYIEDVHRLGVTEFYKKENPAAMQEISAVMLESARKEMWNASEEQIRALAELHVELVKEFGAEPGGFSGENKKLHDFISQKVNAEDAETYKKEITSMETGSTTLAEEKSGQVLKQENLSAQNQQEKNDFNGILIASILIVLFIGIIVYLQKRRK